MSAPVPSNTPPRRVPMGSIYDFTKRRFVEVPASLIKAPASPDARPYNLPPAKP